MFLLLGRAQLLTYNIIKWKVPKPRAGSREHRHIIFERTIAAVGNNEELYPGAEYFVDEERCVILAFASTIEECEWDGLKVKCIEVWLYESQFCAMVHPSDLKEVK